MDVFEQPLVVIVGPTGSGKTEISIRLAQKYNGEIICADSRTIFKGLDTGTAKPNRLEQQTVPHHMIDVVGPGELFTVVDFQRGAKRLISEIRARGRVPFIVGGSSLYIDSVLFDYKFTSKRQSSSNSDLASLTIEELKEYCNKNHIELPENHKNKRYLLRAIELKGVNRQRRQTPIDNTIIVGITTSKEHLIHKLESRVNKIFSENIVNEATKFGRLYGWNSEAMKGNVYRVVKQMIDGTISVTEAKDKSLILDWRLAKKQLTWLRRNPFIRWCEAKDVETYISQLLDDRQR